MKVSYHIDLAPARRMGHNHGRRMAKEYLGRPGTI
jgi:hypothetical protein